MSSTSTATHRCPVWMGYFLASGLRKLLQNPTKIIAPHVQPGMTALDLGCAMGFFTLPLARAVGPKGKVIAVDVEPRMLAILTRRAQQAGLDDRIETHACPEDGLGLRGRERSVDFVLAIAVMHELADQDLTLSELAPLVKPGGRLLLAEPAFHVTQDEFEHTVTIAQQRGFTPADPIRIRLSRTMLMTRGSR